MSSVITFPRNSFFTKPTTFCFFLEIMVCLIENWSIKSRFNIICNNWVNVSCFHVDYKAACIYVTQFCFLPLFWFHIIVQKPIHYYVNIFRKWKYKYFKLRSLVVSSWFSQMHFIYFTNRQANGQRSFRFCPHPRIFFLASYLFFGPLYLKALVGDSF